MISITKLFHHNKKLLDKVDTHVISIPTIVSVHSPYHNNQSITGKYISKPENIIDDIDKHENDITKTKQTRV